MELETKFLEKLRTESSEGISDVRNSSRTREESPGSILEEIPAGTVKETPEETQVGIPGGVPERIRVVIPGGNP